MKPSRKEIHEQKCPDRFKCQTQYKQCPYDPLHKVKKEEYEDHLLKCKSRPKISIEEEREIEKAKTLNDIATEQEQIRYARQKYYKNCVEEPEITGISKKTQKKNKKKQDRNLREKFSELNKKESDHVAAMANKVDDDDDGNESHNLENFDGDKNFDLEFESKREDKIISFEKKNKNENKEKEIKKGKNDNNSSKKNSNKINEINFQNNQKMFYVYDPNEEDKDISKYSANIIVPEEVYKILGYE
jgi:hypothetical protein